MFLSFADVIDIIIVTHQKQFDGTTGNKIACDDYMFTTS